MANAALVIRWGTGIIGREEIGLGVFMASMKFWGELKAKGEVEDFRVYSFPEGDLSHATGMAILEGSTEQIGALVAREDYRTLVTKAVHIVGDVSVDRAETGEAVMQGVERLVSVRKELSIIA